MAETIEHPPALPARAHDGHKGTFGTVGVLGGQAALPRVMLGGPAFSALAALRSGAGLAVLAVPEPLMAAALVVAPSATGLALTVDERGSLVPSEVARIIDGAGASFDCLAIGPGFGVGTAQAQIITRLIARDEQPLVLDADALNNLAATPDFARDLHARAIITPHPGEFRRLATALALTIDLGTPEGRRDGAERLAQRLGCVVVLKGHRTVVTDGVQTYVNVTGGPVLATAGTGDVLTGMIAGLVAQWHRCQPVAPSLGLLECACLAVHAHGLAGDLWSQRHGDGGLLATDLLIEIPGALAELRREPAT